MSFSSFLLKRSYLGLSTYFGHRKNHGFSRGISKHQGVTRPPHSSRCEARVGRVFRNKYLHLGTDGDPEISSVANTEYTKWLKQQGSASCLHSSHTEHYNFAEFRTVYFSNFAIGEGKPILLQDLPSRSGSSGKTSRSALSLLLRSSMYKKLVENNSNEPDAKIKEEDVKDGMKHYENINRH